VPRSVVVGNISLFVDDQHDLRSRVVPHRPNFCRIGRVEPAQMQKGRYAAKRGFMLDKTFRVQQRGVSFDGSRMVNRALYGLSTL
jgi:hypothetical protein